MNEQTLKLIEGLAQKLETTSEYLWGVLIKQAPIEACINIGYIVFVVGMGCVLWKIHLKLLRKPPGDRYDTYYEKHDGVSAIILGVITIGWLICFFVTMCLIGNIITGFYNPEYWALDKVLNSIKPTN